MSKANRKKLKILGTDSSLEANSKLYDKSSSSVNTIEYINSHAGWLSIFWNGVTNTIKHLKYNLK
jgi:hypothetical protein